MEYHIDESTEMKLREKINDLFLLCSKNGIPAFATFAIHNGHEKTEYLSTDKEYINRVLSPGSSGLILADDKIKEHIRLCLPNHRVVNKKFDQVINADELESLFSFEDEIFPLPDDSGYDWGMIENDE